MTPGCSELFNNPFLLGGPVSMHYLSSWSTETGRAMQLASPSLVTEYFMPRKETTTMINSATYLKPTEVKQTTK